MSTEEILAVEDLSEKNENVIKKQKWKYYEKGNIEINIIIESYILRYGTATIYGGFDITVNTFGEASL